MFNSVIAMAPPQQGQGGGEIYSTLIMFGLIIGIFYFMIIIHAVLMVFGAIGNLLVLLAVSMVKSKSISDYVINII